MAKTQNNLGQGPAYGQANPNFQDRPEMPMRAQGGYMPPPQQVARPRPLQERAAPMAQEANAFAYGRGGGMGQGIGQGMPPGMANRPEGRPMPRGIQNRFGGGTTAATQGAPLANALRAQAPEVSTPMPPAPVAPIAAAAPRMGIPGGAENLTGPSPYVSQKMASYGR